MYTIDFDQYKDQTVEIVVTDNNQKTPLSYSARKDNLKLPMEKLFLAAFKDEADYLIIKKNLATVPSPDSYYIQSFSIKENKLQQTANKEVKNIPERIYKSYSMIFRKNHSKFPTSKIYGLKEKLDACPNILLNKEDYKKKYKADLIPEYNYDLDFELTDKNYFDNFKDALDKQINPIADHCVKEILEVFSTYGEIETIHPRKPLNNSQKLCYFIKNSISFSLEIEKKFEYKISTEGLPIPNIKIKVKLQKSELIHKESKKKAEKGVVKTFNQKYVTGSNYQHFTIEIRNFDFLANKNYYAICMTPHGYLRLKKEYSKDFFKKIIFHYQFKKFFEKYEIEMNHDELEDNPQAFFDLVSMMTL